MRTLIVAAVAAAFVGGLGWAAGVGPAWCAAGAAAAAALATVG